VDIVNRFVYILGSAIDKRR